MYRTGLRRRLSAMHFFDVDGPEGEVHSHPYVVELVATGEELDDNGYLVDLDTMAIALEDALGRLEGKVLNDLPEFSGSPPSVESLARVIWGMTAARLPAAKWVSVKVWESDDAWASYGMRTDG
jgi:6-pyruvoyltetrahydropterin/6-carboxytetrahydropterin synthase